MAPFAGELDTIVGLTMSAPGPVVKPAVTVPLIKLPAVSRTPVIVSVWAVLDASRRLGVRVRVRLPLERVRVTESDEPPAFKLTPVRLVG